MVGVVRRTFPQPCFIVNERRSLSATSRNELGDYNSRGLRYLLHETEQL